MLTVKDQLDRALTFKQIPKRIVSLVPSQTELLVDLGLEKFILGITKFCVHPKYLKTTKTIVGGTKNINYTKIVDLQPNIIICNKEENNKEIVEKCEKITQVYVSDIYSTNDIVEFIQDLGTLFSVENKARKLIDELHLKLNDFKSFIVNKPQKKVAYFIWRNPWMVAGGSTFINALLKLNNYENIFEDQHRYPEIAITSLRNLDLDLILLSSEPYPFKEEHIQEIKKYSDAKILLVDGEYFSWYGSRLMKSFEYFKTLHP